MNSFKRAVLATTALCIVSFTMPDMTGLTPALAGCGPEKPWRGGTKAKKKKVNKPARKRAVRKRPVKKKKAVKRSAKKKKKVAAKAPSKKERAAFQEYKTSVRKRLNNLNRIRRRLTNLYKKSIDAIFDLKKRGQGTPENPVYDFHKKRAATHWFTLVLLGDEAYDLQSELDNLKRYKPINKKPVEELFQFDRTESKQAVKDAEKFLKAYQAANAPKQVIDGLKNLLKEAEKTDRQLEEKNTYLRSVAN